MSARVLVVDDSLTVRMDLQEHLEAAGLAVSACASIAEATAALAREHFDLMVLDLVLPDGDGLELLRTLRADPARAHLPVMLLSTEAEIEDRIRGLRTGAEEFVGKPYQPHYVLTRARALLGSPHPPSDPSRPRILIIEDSATFAAELSELLQTAGFEATVATSGKEGLSLAEALRPQAVIVDGVLPDLEGPELIRRIRLDAALRRTPCMLLTASGERANELRALDSGADAYLRKETHPTVILARLRALLRSSGGQLRWEAPSALGAKRILTVDDSHTFLDRLATELRRDGYEPICAFSGEEALQLLLLQSVDCILLDVVMPGASGTEICQQLRQDPRWRDIPVLLLTSMDEREAMVEGINAGADDYIVKSGDFVALKARLRAQLRRRQFEEENRHIQAELLRKDLEAREARAAREAAEARARLLADLEVKNAELEQARKAAQQESDYKSKFLANMSHELRTPLNAVIGFSELLDQELFGPLNDTQKEYVRHIWSSGRHLLGLINDILDLSKIAAGRMELRREWIPLSAVLDSVRGGVQPLAGKQGVQVDYAVADDFPLLYVEPIRLRQILYNLLSNAIKFTPSGGSVQVRAIRDGEEAEIAVSDTGVGIKAEDLPKLFREFEQLVSDSSAKPQGTGLGLALTKQLVELHGGRISVESVEKKGSTFRVRLPVQPDGAPSLPPIEKGRPGPAEEL